MYLPWKKPLGGIKNKYLKTTQKITPHFDTW